MAISSAGIGSNLDVNSIVNQLMSLEQQPLTKIVQKEASFAAKLTAIGSLKGALSSFQTAVRALSDVSKFQAVTVTPADATIATAAGSSAATPGSYSLEITKLAQAQKLIATGQATTSAIIGEGTLTFDFGEISGATVDVSGKYTGATFTSSGSGTKTVTIDSTNSSLAGIRDAINSASIGVTATIINDGGTSPYRLVLTDTSTGKTNSMKISVAGGTGTLSGLLSHDPGADGGQALSETVTAQNAEFEVDGIAISKTSNTVSDVIPGVTLTLAKTNANSPTKITVARDTSTVMGSVGTFVKAYNDINKTLSDVSAYDPVTKKASILTGDASVRNMQAQIRGVLNTAVAGGASAYTILSQVGVTVQKDGTLALDSTKLQAAMTSNFNDVAGLFAAVGKSSDSLVTYTGATTKTAAGAYAVNVTRLATFGSTTGSAAVASLGHGNIKGSTAISSLEITGANDTLDVTLDGVSATVTLTAGTYASYAALAAEVQTQINANFGTTVTVTESAGVLKIAADSSGVASAVNVTGGNGKANLLGASPTVTAGSQTSITAGVNDTLTVQLDGTTATVTLAEGNYSYATLAAEVQSKINGVASFVSAGSAATVTQSAGVITITSNRYGSASNASITGGNGQTNLIGGAPTVVAGLDAAGTINNVSASGSGQYLTGATGNASEGLKVQITGGALGARGTVNYSQGYAYQFVNLADLILSSTGPISSRTEGINATLKSLAQDKQRFTDRLVNIEKRYRAQFTALDMAMANMTKTSAFLTQQLDALNKSTS